MWCVCGVCVCVGASECVCVSVCVCVCDQTYKPLYKPFPPPRNASKRTKQPHYNKFVTAEMSSQSRTELCSCFLLETPTTDPLSTKVARPAASPGSFPHFTMQLERGKFYCANNG